MLRHLRVTNFAILSDVSLDLEPGFNVLTGETGAGKSLIVEAVNLLRGGRASADIPRTGAKEAVVEAVFELTDLVRESVQAFLVKGGIPCAGDELLVRRVIHRGGRSRTYVNGALTTATLLASVGALLVDLSGQHQHQGLVDPKRHRASLDAFAGNEEHLRRMSQGYEALREAKARLEALQTDDEDRGRRLEYLRYQLEELDAAALMPGEDAELERERMVLASVDKRQLAVNECDELLYTGDGSAVERLELASQVLDANSGLDPKLAECGQLVHEARTLAEEAARSIQAYASRLDTDPGRLEEVEDRLTLLRKLARKYGGTIVDILKQGESFREEIYELENRDERLTAVREEYDKAKKAAEKTAKELTKRRVASATKLEREVSAALTELGMAGAQVIVHIEDLTSLGSEGMDKVELLLAANSGETAKPLSRVASGGELSRIMLALKLVLRRADTVASYVFDEVDTGIGGATAEVVGGQIRQVADQRQVLCVTHLPQIAAFGDAHFHVSKTQVDGRTETAVTLLSNKERQTEIARMVGGVKITTQARAHAKAMLETARAR